MKKSKIVSSLLIVMLVLLSFSVVAFADEHLADTVVDIAIDTEGEFTILEAALVEAGLVDTLKGDGPFTVFAPTDEAFQNLLDALGIEAKQLLAHPDLANVLLYHVVSGKVMSGDLVDGDVETVLGENITVDAENFIINESNILVDAELFDLEAENGVVHVIDAVLVPSEDSFDPADTPSLEDLEDDTPVMGDIGMLPYIFVGALGVSGLVVMKKRK